MIDDRVFWMELRRALVMALAAIDKHLGMTKAS